MKRYQETRAFDEYEPFLAQRTQRVWGTLIFLYANEIWRKEKAF